jgi:hypothetical protein
MFMKSLNFLLTLSDAEVDTVDTDSLLVSSKPSPLFCTEAWKSVQLLNLIIQYEIHQNTESFSGVIKYEFGAKYDYGNSALCTWFIKGS